MFTKEGVELAWFASRIALDAEANQGRDQSFEDAVTDSLWQLASIAGSKEEREVYLAELQAEYEQGQAILAQAHLVIGNRFQRFTANTEPLISPDAPTIQASAGHIATSEAVREVTLVANTADNWMTPAEVAEATGTSDSQWRNKAAAGDIPGAVKKGKQWLLPRSVLRAQGVEV
jgi:hypothetical protein